MITVQVDQYDQGKVVTLSPNLWLVLEVCQDRPRPGQATGTLCHRCGRDIETAQLPCPEGARLLRCPCVSVVYAGSFNREQILTHWRAWRRLKSQIESRIAPVGEN
jgi:hypothetical protein